MKKFSTSLQIKLTEPIIFLRGFDHNEASSQQPAMLRGSLVLHLPRSSKIKSIQLNFSGKGRTEWPEGIGKKRNEFDEETDIVDHTWHFYSSDHHTDANTNTHTHHPDSSGDSISSPSQSPNTPTSASASTSTSSGISRFLNHRGSDASPRASLEDFRNDSHSSISSTKEHKDNFKIFNSGTYSYPFELPLENTLPETIEGDFGSVFYRLTATVERAGALSPNMSTHQDIRLIRCLTEQSLELTEPIVIDRNWEDQLHYTVAITGKSYPIGSKLPISFKLQPLDKIHLHRIYVTLEERTDYFAHGKRVARHEGTRKFPLLREGQEGTVLAQNQEIGPWEYDFALQIPDCKQKVHFGTTWENIRVYHWLKVVLRLSKLVRDGNDPPKRKQFDIIIESPIQLLSCHCSQDYLALPKYSATTNTTALMAPCRCEDAFHINRTTTTTEIAPDLRAGAIPTRGNGIPLTPWDDPPAYFDVFPVQGEEQSPEGSDDETTPPPELREYDFPGPFRLYPIEGRGAATALQPLPGSSSGLVADADFSRRPRRSADHRRNQQEPAEQGGSSSEYDQATVAAQSSGASAPLLEPSLAPSLPPLSTSTPLTALQPSAELNTGLDPSSSTEIPAYMVQIPSMPPIASAALPEIPGLQNTSAVDDLDSDSDADTELTPTVSPSTSPVETPSTIEIETRPVASPRQVLTAAREAAPISIPPPESISIAAPISTFATPAPAPASASISASASSSIAAPQRPTTSPIVSSPLASPPSDPNTLASPLATSPLTIPSAMSRSPPPPPPPARRRGARRSQDISQIRLASSPPSAPTTNSSSQSAGRSRPPPPPPPSNINTVPVSRPPPPPPQNSSSPNAPAAYIPALGTSLPAPLVPIRAPSPSVDQPLRSIPA